jgi:enoyl-CoA hydratase/carnithine racemase
VSGDPVRVEQEGGIAWLILDRPDAANALSKDLLHGLRDALVGLRVDDELRALVLTGAGERVFCAVADLKERRGMNPTDTRRFLREARAVCDEICEFPRPTIAALNGAALGGGLEIALCCDLRIAAEGIELGLPEVRVGIIPGIGGTQRLPRLLGVARAKDLILTGRRITADRAFEMGLVSAVVPRAHLRTEALRWAADLAAAAPLAATAAKRAIDEGWGKSLGEALDVEQKHYDVVLESDDRDEGLRAFAEKRKPRFRGK